MLMTCELSPTLNISHVVSGGAILVSREKCQQSFVKQIMWLKNGWTSYYSNKVNLSCVTVLKYEEDGEWADSPLLSNQSHT